MTRNGTLNTQTGAWDDVRAGLGFTEDEERDIALVKAEQLAAVRAHRLAEVRKQHDLTQSELSEILGISQERVSQIERAGLAQTQLSTVAAYVQALGGRLRVVADFGDEQFVLG